MSRKLRRRARREAMRDQQQRVVGSKAAARLVKGQRRRALGAKG